MIQTRWCCVHGDLHGENILVSSEGGVLVIDYGDVGFGSAVYDPMTLELSAVLQENPTRGPDWPTADACRQWHDLMPISWAAPCRSSFGLPGMVREANGRPTRTGGVCVQLPAAPVEVPGHDKDRILALLEGVHGCWGDS